MTGMQALEQFDSRLVGAVRKLQDLGKWETVVARGGSSPHGLSLGTSQYDVEVRTHEMIEEFCLLECSMCSAWACSSDCTKFSLWPLLRPPITEWL